MSTLRPTILPAALIVLGMAAQTSAQAQGREVVQALPSAASEELKDALARLARSPRNLEALIAAGTASLELDDVEAAVGFFGRAQELAPDDPRIKAGRAAAYVRTRRPVEALRLFQEAEEGGVEIVRLAGDYGLAFDLVGNNREAQARYRRALARGPSDEITRRLALSQAIDGNDQGFEQTLRPLLARRDFAAYRTRAFGLAILGKPDDAVAIAEAVMPRAMAAKMEPYLRFMPTLSKAQQAAAGNLGIYPTAARIGRDDPRIAALSGESSGERSARTADAGLAPSGAPLGGADSAPASTRDGETVTVASREEAERAVRVARREAASDPLSRTRQRPRIVERTESQVADQPVSERVAAATPTPEPEPVAAQPAPSSGELPATVAATAQPVAEPVVVAALETETASPGFDLGRVAGSNSGNANAQSTGAELEPASVADAFADLAAPVAAPTTAAAGAVDITAIEAPREVEPEPEPAKPVHPSRFWVQVATGRDRNALKFDWRRLSRAADGLLEGKGPFVTPWGQTNRLLAGPYPSRDAARKALNSLQEKDIDSFTFTSPEGQEIEPLG